MEDIRFYILDVFCQQKYGGNQLAVVIAPPEVSSEWMKDVTREFNYSETVFLFPDARETDTCEARIFTPAREIPFAGHPTLGAAFVVGRELGCVNGGKVVLSLKAGPITVTFSEEGGAEILWMRQPAPVFGRTYSPADVRGLLKNLRREDIDARFPAQEVSTGLPFIIVPLKNLQAVKRAKMDMDGYAWEPKHPIYLFCPETYHGENHLNARMFGGVLGIPEDPATGSACGCLGGYLLRHDYFGKAAVDVRVEQGYEIGRSALLRLRAWREDGEIAVQVGGRVIKTAEGALR
jgi:trans-2,3-dihydro-3-hydroxyanthranilate isomerase